MTTSKMECAKPVVTQLKETYKKLAVAEANVEMLTKMTKNMVGTNDVRNFVCKQVDMRRVNKSFDRKTIKKLMKKKWEDACAFASRLQRQKTNLKKR